jgi:hypothetical protein
MNEGRFSLDDDLRIIDHKNWKNNRIARLTEPLRCQDDARNAILWERLIRNFASLLPPRLLHNSDDVLDPIGGPLFKHADCIYKLMVTVGLANRAGGYVASEEHIESRSREKSGSLREITSIGHFMIEIDRIMHDLYGQYSWEVSHSLRNTVVVCLKALFRKKGKELIREYDNATEYDYTNNWIIGEPIAVRVRAIRGRPTECSVYSLKFADEFERIYTLEEWKRSIATRRREQHEVRDYESFYEIA